MLLASLVLCSLCSERGWTSSVGPCAPRTGAAPCAVASAACSVVRYAFRLVTATNRALLFPVLGMRWGLCVFHFHFCLHHCLASRILFVRIFCNGEAVRFGRNPCGEVNSLMTEGVTSHIHPRASANPINRPPNTNYSCESSTRSPVENFSVRSHMR